MMKKPTAVKSCGFGAHLQNLFAALKQILPQFHGNTSSWLVAWINSELYTQLS